MGIDIYGLALLISFFIPAIGCGIVAFRESMEEKRINLKIRQYQNKLK